MPNRNILSTGSYGQKESKEQIGMKQDRIYRDLTPEEIRVILHKGTEPPWSGEYVEFFEKGTYLCKRCLAPLFRSEAKFRAHCGWPSFDEAFPGAIREVPDPDGVRTEILCAACEAHLGHVFRGEGLTPKNVRFCVNSIAMTFLRDQEWKNPAKAYFAGGCFWGVAYYFETLQGVQDVVVGYMGGVTQYPTYEEVCTGKTGHYEVVEVTYDPTVTSYEDLAKLFFEIHDPTQADGQGPDIGPQYRSAIFFGNDEELDVARKLIQTLKGKGYNVVTKILPITEFYRAEAYHQNYYRKHGLHPSCHRYTPRF